MRCSYVVQGLCSYALLGLCRAHCTERPPQAVPVLRSSAALQGLHSSERSPGNR